MKTVVRILFSAFFVSILVGGFAYAAPGFNLMSLGGMDFFKFFKDDASNVGIEASAFHTRINDSYLPSPVDNYNYIRGKTFLGNDTVVVDASGNLGIGTLTPGAKLDVVGNVRTSSKFISTLATGTAPLEVTSTTVNTNLNADMVDGLHAPTGGVNPGANALVRTDGNGYTFTNYINSSTVNNENPTISQVIVTNGSDNYYRKAGISALTSAVQSNASGTWPIAISGNAATASALTNMNVSQFANNAGYLTQGFVSTSGQPASTALANESGNGAFMVQSQGTAGTAGAAFMSFHRPSAFAAYFGIDTDNVWKVGGWSMGATSYPLLLGSGYTNGVITGTTPTAASHLATKAYVDAAVGAAGGGGGGVTTYLGATSTSYNGNWGGLNGGNAKCQAQYGAGARVMNTADMSRISYTGTYVNGWINCDSITIWSDMSGNLQASCASAPFEISWQMPSYHANCSSGGGGAGWAGGGNYGMTVSGYGQGVYWSACSGSYPIHCVK